MTEPQVASSDATNVELRIEKDGNEWVLNGHKWFITNAMYERTKILIVMGKSDPENQADICSSHRYCPQGYARRDARETTHNTRLRRRADRACGNRFRKRSCAVREHLLGEGRGLKLRRDDWDRADASLYAPLAQRSARSSWPANARTAEPPLADYSANTRASVRTSLNVSQRSRWHACCC